MSPVPLVEIIVAENRKLLKHVSKEAVDRFIQAIDKAEKIFCAAQGRSGHILRSFCMRLMHLGYQAFFVGETITPKIGRKDIMIVLSGSGQTLLTYELINLGRKRGARAYGLVGVENSPIAHALDYFICLPGGSKGEPPEQSVSIQPPGSLFEQAAFILLETMALTIYQRCGSDPQAILDRHTNLE
ncbi:MAG: 6-phospho-3-hexuloisomerase [Deltaproteobacteria bacterium]|nr:MAG: 6-phospho-3-hexuloisomerase [Deltaproteobacteria bacterium]